MNTTPPIDPGTHIDIVDPRIEDYARGHVTPPDAASTALMEQTMTDTRVPMMMGGLAETRLLEAFIVASGAKRVLELGTFTGFGALAMASALPEDGKVVTIEFDEHVAGIARKHFDASPLKDKIELLLGDARELVKEVEGPLDLVWLDASKAHYREYCEAVLPKLAPNGLIAADNCLWGGRMLLDDVPDIQLSPTDAETITMKSETDGVVAFNKWVQNNDELVNVLLTVGDGIMLIRKA